MTFEIHCHDRTWSTDGKATIEAALWSDDLAEAKSCGQWLVVRAEGKMQSVARYAGDGLWLEQGVRGEKPMSWKPEEYRKIFSD